jgi:hypothetical protein
MQSLDFHPLKKKEESYTDDYRLLDMLKSPNSKAALPDDAPILKLKPNLSGRNCIYK